jgi:D-mannonate dehydratase
MDQACRWVGPKDAVTLVHESDAGKTGIVSAVRDHDRGKVWPDTAIIEETVALSYPPAIALRPNTRKLCVGEL